jgi:hypothetical protein
MKPDWLLVGRNSKGVTIMTYKYNTLVDWIDDSPVRRIRVYGASKLAYAGMWDKLKKDPAWTDHIEFTMRWSDLHMGSVPDLPEFARLFWQHDHEDVRKSDAVMVYSEPHDHLKGALVEAGMGLAFGLRILVVGENAGFSTWQFHPSVVRVKNLDQARLTLLAWQFEIHSGK